MGKIRVNTDALEQQKQQMEQITKMIHSVSSDISSVNRNLSWKIASRSQIKGMLKNYASYTSTLEQKNKKLSKILHNAAKQYQKTEKKLEDAEVKEIKTQDDDILKIIKDLLSGDSYFGGNDEAGIAKDIIEYLEKLVAFLNGDKLGFTGAGDWCSLADASFNVWKGLYDWYCEIYKDAPEGFFSDIVQKRVKCVGLASAFVALIGASFSASDGLDQKEWQSIVADYLGCGKELVSVIGAGYEVKNFEQLKSLADLKAGPWTPAAVYEAVAKSVIASIEQGFRSHEKYSADGVWDVGDTGATGIDISMAGLYGFCDSLTGGLDNIVFGLVDRLSGGDGNSDLSYVEKAAEGYKIMANTIADWIRRKRSGGGGFR